MLRFLEGAGCPACGRGVYAEERYVFGFVYEHYTDWQTLTELRASLGFCDAHTRRLLGRHEAQWVMRVVYEAVVPAALERLRSERPGDRRRPCPMCESVLGAERAFTRAIVAAVSDPAVAEAYGGTAGFCLPHLLHALKHSGPEETTALVRIFKTGLRDAVEPQSLIERLAGRDCDAAARRETRARLENLDVSGVSGGQEAVLEVLRRRLRVDACPSCLAGGLGERRYLGWLAHESRSNPTGLAAEGVWLCRRHLHDLAAEDVDAAAYVADHERRRLEGELGRVYDCLVTLTRRTVTARLHAARLELRHIEGRTASLPARAGRAVGALLRRRRSAVREALAPFGRARDCDACRAVAVAEERETTLLLAALPDRPTAQLYEGTHGLCLRHALALPAASGVSAPTAVLRARLEILSWELEEAGRKQTWSMRYEAKGDELTAWRRAPAQLDGRVFLGAPPP